MVAVPAGCGGDPKRAEPQASPTWASPLPCCRLPSQAFLVPWPGLLAPGSAGRGQQVARSSAPLAGCERLGSCARGLFLLAALRCSARSAQPGAELRSDGARDCSLRAINNLPECHTASLQQGRVFCRAGEVVSWAARRVRSPGGLLAPAAWWPWAAWLWHLAPRASPVPVSPCHRELAHDCLGWDAEAFPWKAAGTLTFPFLLSKPPHSRGRAERGGLTCLLPGRSGKPRCWGHRHAFPSSHRAGFWGALPQFGPGPGCSLSSSPGCCSTAVGREGVKLESAALLSVGLEECRQDFGVSTLGMMPALPRCLPAAPRSGGSSPVSRGGFRGWRASRQPARASLAAGDDSALTFARGLAGGEATCLASRLLSSKASPAPRTRLRRCPWKSTSRKLIAAGAEEY